MLTWFVVVLPTFLFHFQMVMGLLTWKGLELVCVGSVCQLLQCSYCIVIPVCPQYAHLRTRPLFEQFLNTVVSVIFPSGYSRFLFPRSSISYIYWFQLLRASIDLQLERPMPVHSSSSFILDFLAMATLALFKLFMTTASCVLLN